MKLLLGNNLDLLKTLPDNSVDAIITDPPYGLGEPPDALSMLRDWMEAGHHDVKSKRGFMGKTWDAFVPQPAQWKECLRVLKPGGHTLAFAGTRTQDLMALGMRIAGFEIRDIVAWVYGSGFPKSHDVSKAIDKAGGSPIGEWFAEWLIKERTAKNLSQKHVAEEGKFYKNVNHGGLVANWELGYGLPSAPQFNKLCDILGTDLARREEVTRKILGFRKINPGLAFTSEGLSELPITQAHTPSAIKWDGWGTALKPSLEPITLARKPMVSTVAENVMTHSTGAINIGRCRVGDGNGRWPANLIHDGSDEVLAAFPDAKGQQGDLKNHSKATPASRCFGALGPKKDHAARGDSGSAARFFYCAKASAKDRNEGCEELPDKEWANDGACIPERENRPFNPSKNNHPTVKPTELMRYLCRLVTPPGGTILDPWMGSGSTGKAARLEGFDFIGMEQDAGYFKIAQARCGVLPVEDDSWA